MRKLGQKTTSLIMASLLAATPLFWFKPVNALPMLNTSVTIGSSVPTANTTHNFAFTLQSVDPVGSIRLEYCANSPSFFLPCFPPSGLDVSNANLDGQTGEIGFTIHPSSNNNTVILTRPPAATSAIPVTYNFSNVVNHDLSKSTSYVRISTHAADDGSGPRIDESMAAYATTSPMNVAGFVPPYLTFCVGVTVAPRCTSTDGTMLDFGELVPTGPRYLSSQFAVATNDPTGYSTTVAGPTMMSGNNIIDPSDPPRTSQAGTNQFGMNLRANSNPSIGADPSGVGTGTIAAGFNTPNQFFFKNQVVAASTIPSDFNVFTASYLVNVRRGQSPGIYSTTLTYIASVAF